MVQVINGAIVNLLNFIKIILSLKYYYKNIIKILLKFWILTYSFSSVNKTGFEWSIDMHSNILELEKNCNQYREKYFYHDILFY